MSDDIREAVEKVLPCRMTCGSHYPGDSVAFCEVCQNRRPAVERLVREQVEKAEAESAGAFKAAVEHSDYWQAKAHQAESEAAGLRDALRIAEARALFSERARELAEAALAVKTKEAEEATESNPPSIPRRD